MMDFLWLALGIAAAGFFIGEGIRNINNPNPKNMMDYLNEEEDHELIKEKHVHHFLGVSKEDATKLLEEYPSVPHIRLNGTIYYPKEKLRNWIKEIRV
ncbi:DNA-binding protein [Alkalihalophilus lindianensis]|uniref:DNA-binding protein n=1 Tax=Alkalihalophilus lindianensis TaxID=1630542 RepID=A0ABU3XDW7_9BACI|nr:DNA-binding protein [Alkalihalophilus lindianensis]MDV2686079.1 DNA-binding protein [Alkalihalophilus lindianensis]